MGLETLESMSQAVWYNRWTLSKFAPYIRGDILETGCGIGNFTSTLTEFGRVWACDIKQSYVARTAKRAGDGVRVGVGNIETGDLFTGSKRFDTILCLNVLEHIRDDDRTLRNLYARLKPGGHLILLVPIVPILYGTVDRALGHFRRYDPATLAQTLAATGLTPVYTRKLNFLGAVAWYVSGHILRRQILSRRQLFLFDWFAPLILPFEDTVEPPVGTSVLFVCRKS